MVKINLPSFWCSYSNQYLILIIKQNYSIWNDIPNYFKNSNCSTVTYFFVFIKLRLRKIVRNETNRKILINEKLNKIALINSVYTRFRSRRVRWNWLGSKSASSLRKSDISFATTALIPSRSACSSYSPLTVAMHFRRTHFRRIPTFLK